MSDGNLTSLIEQVGMLQVQVDNLTARLEAVEAGNSHTVPVNKRQTQGSAAASQPVEQEGMLKRAGTGTLLPRVAAVCFMMVIALILRTITDNQIISMQVGSLLGLTYGVALIGAGWWLYEKKSRLAPVFPVAGMLLLFSIVLETHARFESLPTFWAYVILLVAGLVAVGQSLRYRAAALICIGTLGTAFVGMAIDFPYPLFPFLGLLLLFANVAAFFSHRRELCLFLRYAILAFTVVFLMLWTFKLNMPVGVCDEPIEELLSVAWFFPTLMVFWGIYLVMVILNTMNKELQLGFYEGMLPTISGVGVFVAGIIVAGHWYWDTSLFGFGALGFAAIHFILGWWLAKRDREGATGSNAFVFAGVCLVACGLAAVAKDLVWVLPMWSVLAYILALLSYRWHSGGVRVTSYLLQLVACAMAVFSGVFSTQSSLPFVSILAAATMAAVSLMQYRWSRQHVPNAVHSAYFSWLDKKDTSGVVLLIAGLVSGYYFAHQGLFAILSRTMTDYAAALQSGQSVFINMGAVLLLLIALRGRSAEIASVAGMVALLGAVKVFIIDLFGIQGVALVISVFSFGIVAAVASVVMGKWQKGGERYRPVDAIGDPVPQEIPQPK
jgi:hypothetical protein